jgi:hypothetical protein
MLVGLVQFSVEKVWEVEDPKGYDLVGACSCLVSRFTILKFCVS